MARKKKKNTDILYETGTQVEKVGNRTLGHWRILSILFAVLVAAGFLFTLPRLELWANLGIVIFGSVILVGYLIYRARRKKNKPRGY